MGMMEITFAEYLIHLTKIFPLFTDLHSPLTHAVILCVSSLAAFVCLLAFSDKIMSFVCKFSKANCLSPCVLIIFVFWIKTCEL